MTPISKAFVAIVDQVLSKKPNQIYSFQHLHEKFAHLRQE